MVDVRAGHIDCFGCRHRYPQLSGNKIGPGESDPELAYGVMGFVWAIRRMCLPRSRGMYGRGALNIDCEPRKSNLNPIEIPLLSSAIRQVSLKKIQY